MKKFLQLECVPIFRYLRRDNTEWIKVSRRFILKVIVLNEDTRPESRQLPRNHNGSNDENPVHVE